MGYEPRADLPIYIAALSPKMLRLAGEIADGVMLWLCNPNYIRDVVVPEVRAGRERAGKELDGFDIVAAVPAAVTDDKAAAYETMRTDLLTYWSLPFYRAMIERSGFGEDIAAVRRGMQAGDVERAKAAISDRFLDDLTAIGSPDEVRAGRRALRGRGRHLARASERSRARTSTATLEAAKPTRPDSPRRSEIPGRASGQVGSGHLRSRLRPAMASPGR